VLDPLLAVGRGYGAESCASRFLVCYGVNILDYDEALTRTICKENLYWKYIYLDRLCNVLV